MSGIKIHSHVHHFVLHKQSKGSAEQVYCRIQNCVNNTALTHKDRMLTVLSGWFFFVSQYSSQRYWNSGVQSNPFQLDTIKSSDIMRGQMLQESSARSVLRSTSISLYGQVKGPIHKGDPSKGPVTSTIANDRGGEKAVCRHRLCPHLWRGNQQRLAVRHSHFLPLCFTHGCKYIPATPGYLPHCQMLMTIRMEC